MTHLLQRNLIIDAILEACHSGARRWRACQVISLQERTLQRWEKERDCADKRTMRVYAPSNKLSELERLSVLRCANSEEFKALAPSQIVPRLANQGIYLASESSFYRILRASKQLTHRGVERPAQKRHKPRALSATAPNQIYSWDISYLPTTVKGVFFYLYMFMDIYSRKIVGWQIYEHESSERASEMMIDICRKEGVKQGQVVLHSDNGSPMKGATMLATLQSLGIMPSLSRPSVSNDNPYSEALFRTVKYRPQYPCKPFESIAKARQWAEEIVQWYNHEHLHSAIRYVTPHERHSGQDKAILANRAVVYQTARAMNPERWSGRPVRNWSPIEIVHLNPEKICPQNGDEGGKNKEKKVKITA
jgi:putative transposase